MPPGIYPRKPAQQRFEEKWMPVPWTGCWLWLGATSSRHGYGYFSGPNSTRAHCVSYFLHRGPIPEGFELDHLCRVRSCVNPNHLEVVTHAENMRRGSASITQCIHGHELIESNVYRDQYNRRHCRQCRKRVSDNWRKNNREVFNERCRRVRQKARLNHLSK